MSPQRSRNTGSARPAVLALVVLAATAAIVLAYAVLTGGKAPEPARPQPVLPRHSKPQPKAQAIRPTLSPKTTTSAPPPAPQPPPGALFWDDFSGPDISTTRWLHTRQGDFKEAVTDILDGRLRFRIGTIGIPPHGVSHLGIRSAQAVLDLTRGPVELAAEIDWNNQANGCYLQAAIYLCPTATDTTPAAEPDWLKFEYVGVPPGKNARACLSRRKAGNLRLLHTEGWPQPDPKDRTGRPIGKQNVLLRLDRDTIQITENGAPLYGPAPHGCDFPRAYIYLQVLSHSNYPPRELFFGPILLRPAPRGGI